jgi:hypothetical protein
MITQSIARWGLPSVDAPKNPNQSLFLFDGRKRTRAPGISPGRAGH